MTYLSLAIVAAFVSTFVQFLKVALDTHKTWTVLVLVAVSLLAAGVYYFASTTSYWPLFLKILVTANTIYGILIQPFEQRSVPQ